MSSNTYITYYLYPKDTFLLDKTMPSRRNLILGLELHVEYQRCCCEPSKEGHCCELYAVKWDASQTHWLTITHSSLIRWHNNLQIYRYITYTIPDPIAHLELCVMSILERNSKIAKKCVILGKIWCFQCTISHEGSKLWLIWHFLNKDLR